MSKIYAEFYHKSVLSGEPIPACGSDSIAFLDARFSKANQLEQAELIATRRGFIGFRLMVYPILPERPLSQVYLIGGK